MFTCFGERPDEFDANARWRCDDDDPHLRILGDGRDIVGESRCRTGIVLRERTRTFGMPRHDGLQAGART